MCLERNDVARPMLIAIRELICVIVSGPCAGADTACFGGSGEVESRDVRSVRDLESTGSRQYRP